MLVFLIAVFFALILWSVVTDLREMIIPNWLNAAVPLLFIPAAILAGMGWGAFGWHLLAGTIAFGICFLLFALGVFGGGDAKLIPGVMLWIGPAAAYPFVLAMALVGGMLGVMLIMMRRFVPATDILILQKTSGVPYAVAIAVGVFFATPASPFLWAQVQPLVG